LARGRRTCPDHRMGLTDQLGFPYILQRAMVQNLTRPGDVGCGGHGHGFVHTAMLCAGVMDSTVDTCYGDSGGPLAVQVGDRGTLAGVTSSGQGCAQFGYPGLYTRVTSVLPWVLGAIDSGRAGYAVSPHPVIYPRDAASLTKTVTVTSTGAQPLHLGDHVAAISGTDAASFSVTATDCANAVLPAGQSCGIEIEFTAGSHANFTAVLEIHPSGDTFPGLVALVREHSPENCTLHQVTGDPGSAEFATAAELRFKMITTCPNDGDILTVEFIPGTLPIDDTLLFQGARNLYIHGNGAVLDAGSHSAILYVISASSAIVQDLTFTNGAVHGVGGAIGCRQSPSRSSE
ncbi:MAG: trypsin-like serine protease, partial [Candidatus Nanopelagicales bacterium]